MSEQQKLLAEAQLALETVVEKREALAARCAHAAEEVKTASANVADAARDGDRKAITAAAAWLTAAQHVASVLKDDLRVVDENIVTLQAKLAAATDAVARFAEAQRIAQVMVGAREVGARFFETYKEFGFMLHNMGAVGKTSANIFGKFYPEAERGFAAVLASVSEYHNGILDGSRAIVGADQGEVQQSRPADVVVARRRVYLEAEVRWVDPERGPCASPRYALVDMPAATAQRAIAKNLAIDAADRRMEAVRHLRVPLFDDGMSIVAGRDAIDLDALAVEFAA